MLSDLKWKLINAFVSCDVFDIVLHSAVSFFAVNGLFLFVSVVLGYNLGLFISTCIFCLTFLQFVMPLVKIDIANPRSF